MTDKKVFKLAGKIMPALVSKGVQYEVCPINADKASVAFSEAIVATAIGEYPLFPEGYFDLTGCGGSKIYFDVAYKKLLGIKEIAPVFFDPDFIEAVLYLFEPREVGDIRDSGISTVFAQRWGFGGHTYPDYATGRECNVRWKLLQYGEEEYGKLPENIQVAIDKVSPHVPPILEQILKIE